MEVTPRQIAVTVLALATLPAWATLLGGCGTQGARISAPPPTTQTTQPALPTFPTRRTVTSVELRDYVGSERCVTCHAAQARQLTSHHAQTLAPITAPRVRAPFTTAATISDTRKNARYQPLQREGVCAIRTRQGARQVDVTPDYAFGSGNRCWTYVDWNGGKPFETRISFYGYLGKWDYTPGQQGNSGAGGPLGRPLDAAETEECFLCHSTAVVKEYEQLRPESSVFGVSCESCHGAGREHLEAVARKSTDLHMVRYSEHRAEISQQLCGKCHRDGNAGDPHSPGTASQLPRLQGLAMAQSACFQKSGGRLTCVTCHNPHQNADATPRATYNAACQSCHSTGTAGQVACPKAPAGDCVSCHMPSQPVNMPTRPQFRTHWIKVWKAAKTRTAATRPTNPTPETRSAGAG